MTTKVLYIEDDENIAEIYITLIKEHFIDFDIEHINEGKKALDTISSNPTKYNLIISDYQIGDVTGADLFKLVNGQMLGIPFIILSGYDCSGDEKLKGFFESHVRNAILIKPVEVELLTEKISWALNSETNLLKIYNQKAKNIDEKVPLNSQIFLKLNYIPCDVYLKLNDGKFVKIINKKEIYETSLIQKLIMKGVQTFFVNRSELSLYSESALKTFNVILKNKKNKLDTVQKSQTINKGIQLLKNNLTKCGFSEHMVTAAEELVEMQVELIKGVDGMDSFLEKFQNFSKTYSDHTRLVSYIAVSILKDLSWDSESTLHKMTLAAMLHDFSLPEEFIHREDLYVDVPTRTDKNFRPTKEQQLFLNHPEESSHIAVKFDSASPELEQCILEHHERPDGKGFPRRLNFNNIHPMSAVLHLADLAANILYNSQFDKDALIKYLEDNKANYQRGFYRKPYNSLCKIIGH